MATPAPAPAARPDRDHRWGGPNHWGHNRWGGPNHWGYPGPWRNPWAYAPNPWAYNPYAAPYAPYAPNPWAYNPYYAPNPWAYPAAPYNPWGAGLVGSLLRAVF